MKIYVASSWRNALQPIVVKRLRDEGYLVYDFKEGGKNSRGFHWSEVDANWKNWVLDVKQYLKGLLHPIAKHGFECDMEALNSCYCCVYVTPCGVSASLEAGYAKGKGKLLIAYTPIINEPELMIKMADYITDDFDVVLRLLKQENNLLLQKQAQKKG
jgi:hypothetical protein